ncbi:hypothetical protein FRB94_001973 [Tulasnella sp. JGI-2019a]|nr:hypothetical protein FRB93_010077 [Tulasnella sp. JGI-2019a]KAG9004935.1 hypothetical protein FRB94_001973 [Tulasnella sp. JGI-2019a]KAG9030152.1 hypothetical protein FRB95_004290 [Tulasnella sp. JGI-2019a]
MAVLDLQKRTPSELLKSIIGALVGPSDRPLLPFVPRSIKVFVLFIFFLNRRSWPLVWHAKVLQYYSRLQLHAFFKARTTTDRRNWLTRISPVGANPFELVSIMKSYTGIDDLYLDRLSETSIRKSCDQARGKVESSLLPALFDDGVFQALGSSHCFFIREIPYRTQYEVRTTIGGWDKKWMYLVHHFVTYPPGSRKSPSIDVTTSTPLETPEGTRAPPPNIPKSNVKVPLPDDAIVHCIAISTTCFKAGRITVPPAVALIAAGLGEPSELRWFHVQKLRFSDHQESATSKPIPKNLMKSIVKGGWKTDEVEGWDRNPDTGVSTFWELGEYEEARQENMKATFERLQSGLHNLKEREY